MKEDNVLWQVRHFVYSHIAETTRPPRVDEATTHFGISIEEATELYKELHNRHALFLDLDEVAIRMGKSVLRDSDRFQSPCQWQDLLRQLRLGHARHSRSFAL